MFRFKRANTLKIKAMLTLLVLTFMAFVAMPQSVKADDTTINSIKKCILYVNFKYIFIL
jgi:hypothetical protein